MDFKNYILFIVEGKKTEPQIINSIKINFFNNNTIILAIYGTVIYHLYSKLFINGKLDYDLDFFQVLKENIKDMPINLSREDISEIYLFFDHDGHATNASNKKIEQMLKYFYNETENGKLYINYPMVEALKHIGKFGKEKMVAKIDNNKRYKNRVSKESFLKYIHIKLYNYRDWKFLVKQHNKRVGYIITQNFRPLWRSVEQLDIFENQKNRYILKKKEVFILSSFPIFLIDYFGYKKFYSQLGRR